MRIPSQTSLAADLRSLLSLKNPSRRTASPFSIRVAISEAARVNTYPMRWCSRGPKYRDENSAPLPQLRQGQLVGQADLPHVTEKESRRLPMIRGRLGLGIDEVVAVRRRAQGRPALRYPPDHRVSDPLPAWQYVHGARTAAMLREPLASRLAHHQYPMMPATIAVPAITTNGMG